MHHVFNLGICATQQYATETLWAVPKFKLSTGSGPVSVSRSSVVSPRGLVAEDCSPWQWSRCGHCYIVLNGLPCVCWPYATAAPSKGDEESGQSACCVCGWSQLREPIPHKHLTESCVYVYAVLCYTSVFKSALINVSFPQKTKWTYVTWVVCSDEHMYNIFIWLFSVQWNIFSLPY